MDFSKTSYSQNMKSPPPSNLTFVPQPLLNPLTSDQIEKCLDDNKKLILAILECISLGKFIESAQYQEMLQHNLTFLSDVANVQLLQGSSISSQAMTSSVQQGNQTHQTQANSTPNMFQESNHVPKLPFMLNTPQLQDQPLNQFLHIQPQQQFQSQLGFRSPANNIGMHQIMQPQFSNSSGMDIQESMQVGPSNGLGKRKRRGGGKS
nr:GRF1-interacting factor 2-like [Ipomoea batatas]